MLELARRDAPNADRIPARRCQQGSVGAECTEFNGFWMDQRVGRGVGVVRPPQLDRSLAPRNKKNVPFGADAGRHDGPFAEPHAFDPGGEIQLRLQADLARILILRAADLQRPVEPG